MIYLLEYSTDIFYFKRRKPREIRTHVIENILKNEVKVRKS